MPTLREELAADIAAAIAGYDQVFEWAGDDYACVRRDQPTTLEIQDAGGEIEDVSFWLVVAKSAFADYDPEDPATFPQFGDALNDGRHQVKTLNGHKDPAAAQLVLGVGSFDR